MSVARHYEMIAAVGKSADLRVALQVLAARVRKLPGCLAVESMQDVAVPARFIFIERWTDLAVHQAAGALLGKDAFSAVMICLAEPTKASNLALIEVGE